MDTQASGPAVRVGDEEIKVTVDIDIEDVLKDSRPAPQSNDAEMDKAARDAVDDRREARPKNTKKGYKKGLACWAAFCTRRQFADTDTVHEKKILLFLKEDVLTKRTRKRQARGTNKRRIMRPSEQPDKMQPLTPETIEAGYTSPLIVLWDEQRSLGSNPHPKPRGGLIKGLMKSLKKEKVQKEREGFADRGVGKLNDGYNLEKYHGLCSLMLKKNDQLGAWLRTRLDIQILHAGVLRGESSRLAELSDISLHRLGGEEGVGTSTPCLILTITDGKTLEAGETDYTGILRHKDPVLCPIASLAFYLLWRFDIEHEAIPDFNDKSTWYRTRLILGKQEEHGSLSYETQALWIQRAFAEANIQSSKVTHTMRGSAIRIADSEGVPEDQLRRAGHWEKGSMSTAYLSRLPRECMRVLAGFSRCPGNYYLRRSAVKPPRALKRKVWPWVDSWLARYNASIVSGRSFADGGLDDCDLSGKALLDLLDWLRETMLQDAAVLQQQFPLFPLWQHPIFCDPAWRPFADEVLIAHNTAEEPMDMRIRKVLPDLEETVRSTREAVLSRVDLHSAKVTCALQEGLALVNEGLNQLRQSIPDQLVTVPRSLINPAALNSYLADLPRQSQPPTINTVATAKTTPSSTSSTAAPAATAPTTAPTATAPAATAPTAGTSLIPLTAGGWPVQPFDLNVANVEDAWREWHVGLGVGIAKRDSILSLEARFRCAWRYEQRIKQWHSRRKKLIHRIEQRVEQGHALQDVFADLNATGKSLDRLRRDIEKGIDIFS